MVESTQAVGLALQAKAAAASAAKAAVTNASAQRILRAAQRGITPIGQVMPTAPTYANNGTTSPVYPSANVSYDGSRYSFSNGTVVGAVGGIFAYVASVTGCQGVTMTQTAGAQDHRRFGHGGGIRFMTDAPKFEISMNTSGNPCIGYVTDSTGVRQRFQASDQVTTVGSAFHSWDFGSAAVRLVELYCGSSTIFRGINVDSKYSIWSASRPDEPKIVMLGDSWMDAGTTVYTNPVRLTLQEYFGERCGVANIIGLSISGTGILRNNGNASFTERVQNGDLDPARIGYVDLVFTYASGNDTAFTDAQEQAGVTALIKLIRSYQPYAVIVMTGPQFTISNPWPQSRYDAVKAGTAAANDANTIYLDNSASGENWLFGNATTGNLSRLTDTTNYHPLESTAPIIAYRWADSMLAAIRAKYGSGQ